LEQTLSAPASAAAGLELLLPAVIAATGFKVDMRRLGFISPRIMASLALEDTTPMFSRYFETSVPASWRPIVSGRCFVLPTEQASLHGAWSQYLARTAPRHAARDLAAA
jgi:hypothetical protein